MALSTKATEPKATEQGFQGKTNQRKPGQFDSASAAAHGQAAVKQKLRNWALALATFLIAFAICIGQNVLRKEPGVTLLFDSGHYIETCRQLVIYWRSALDAGFGLSALSAGSTGFGLLHLPATFSFARFNEYLMLDGPILPALNSLVFLLLGKVPGQSDWQVFLCVQAFLQGLAALLVYQTALTVTKSKKWSFAASIIWALYPPAILSARDVMSETLTVTILLALVAWLSASVDWKPGSKFKLSQGVLTGAVSGILTGLIMLTKSALLVPCGLVLMLAWASFSTAKQRMTFLLSIVFGLLLCLSPWMMYSKKATGHVCLTPQRVPTLNLLMGLDPECDGWSALPYPPAMLMNPDQEGPLPTAMGIVSQNPGYMCNLMLRKIPRLWSQPWNDYRQKTFGLPVAMQVATHSLLLILFVLGLITLAAGPTTGKFKTTAAKLAIRFSLLMILGHLVYMIFGTTLRYGFTAMPFMIIVAVWFVHFVSSQKLWGSALAALAVPTVALLAIFQLGFGQIDLVPWFMELSAKYSLALTLQHLVVAAICLCWSLALWKFVRAGQDAELIFARSNFHFRSLAVFILFIGFELATIAAYATNSFEIGEWHCNLKPQQKAVRMIDLKAIRQAGLDYIMILVDGNYQCESADIILNGHKLDRHLTSVYQYNSLRYPLLETLQVTAGATGHKTADMRQWRAVPVPIDWIGKGWVHLNGENIISIEPGHDPAGLPVAATTIYGEYLQSENHRRPFLSVDYFSHLKMWSSMDGVEGRLMDQKGLAEIPSKCWLQSSGQRIERDLSPSPGRQTGQYRIYFVLGYNRSGKQPAAVDSSGKVSANNFAFDHVFTGKEFSPAFNSVLSASEIKGSANTVVTIAVPEPLYSATHMQVTVVAKYHGLESKNVAALACMFVGSTDSSAFLVPGTPLTISALKSQSAVSQGLGQDETVTIEREIPCRALVRSNDHQFRMELFPVAGAIKLTELKVQLKTIQEPDLFGHWLSIL